MRKAFTITARDKIIPLGIQTKIMGIVNMTPDSFSRDGCLRKTDAQDTGYRYALKQIREGADILDIGGESARPGAPRVEAKEEMERILPLLKRLREQSDIPLSVDTNKTSVAKAALDAGAHIINNIKGVRPNTSLLKMAARYDAAIVLMHIGQGTPRTMQRHVRYHDVIEEICNSLRESVEKCLDIGMKSDKIIIDPGIGFGKTVEHNLIILNRLNRFRRLNVPILVGPSRKSFIGQTLGRDVKERVMGTAASVATSIQNGAHLIRVHDVRAMKNVARMTDSIINEKAS